MVDGGALDGKRALVVGGGSGIGRAVLGAFAVAGARTACLERDAQKCESLSNDIDDCIVTTGDAMSLADNRSAVAAAVATWGGIDVLVLCVGIFDFRRGLGDLADDEIVPAFDEMFHANVASMLLSVKVALPHLRQARGSVVLTGSTSGFYPGRGGVLYMASKFAVRGAVMALAHELAPAVRVNGVAPGGTLGTDLRGPTSLGMEAVRVADEPDRDSVLRSRTPLEVALTPDDVAASFVFLASDSARGITGSFIHPDGGIGAKG